MTPTQLPSRRLRESIAVMAGLAAAVTLMLWRSDGWFLITRPLWLDEIHTALLALRPSPLTVLGDLAAGADFGPPLVALSAWLIRFIARTLSPWMLRAESLACMIGALAFVYAVLRRQFGRSASAAGVIAIGGHNLVVAHMFDGRFYAPWVLCAAFFAWSLREYPAVLRRREIVVSSVAAVLLTTAHWYGIFSLAMMAAAAVASAGVTWRQGLRRVAPAAAGLVAFAMCVPLVIGQRNALSVSTWVPPFSFVQLTELSKNFWTAAVPIVAAAIAVAGVVAGGRQRAGTIVGSALREPGIAALFSLALFPLALAALSVAGQPSMLARYAIPTTLAWGPLVALSAALVGRAATAVLIVWLATAWPREFKVRAWAWRAATSGVQQMTDVWMRAESLGLPVVFQSMRTMYDVEYGALGNLSRGAFLDLPDTLLAQVFPPDWRQYQTYRGLIVERDVVRVHERRFGQPRTIQPGALATRRFVMIVLNSYLPNGYRTTVDMIRTQFPRHQVTTIVDGLLLFAP